MPTGYTTGIAEGITFRKFILTCARAFGACIMQRDNPMDEEPIEPEAETYYVKAMEKARQELSRLSSLTKQEIASENERLYRESLASYLNRVGKDIDLRNKYNAMLAAVMAWTPPTPDHQGLKDFMIQQITDSRKFDCGYEPTPPEKLPDEKWFESIIEKAINDLEYYTKEAQKEEERTAGRVAWIRALKDNLPPIDKED